MRRNLLMKPVIRIPAEYQEVEWVKGAGSRINLLYVPTDYPSVISKFAVNAIGDFDIMGFKANRKPSFIIDCAKSNNNDTVWYNRYGDTSSYNFVYNIKFDIPNVFKIAVESKYGRSIYVDGVIIKDVLPDVDWSTNTQSFNILGGRNAHPGLTMYSFTLYNGATKVRNLVPCYRKSDDVVGFYDLVSDTFFTTSDGTLTKGNDI